MENLFHRYILLGSNVEERDYDGRTALHIAASEGHAHVVQFLLKQWKSSPDPIDRWKRTPLDDARHFEHQSCVQILEKAMQTWSLSNNKDGD
jgi:glutaminase